MNEEIFNMFALQGFQNEGWTPQNVMNALPQGAVPYGNVITWGEPEREASASDIANMYAQAANAAGIGIPIPDPGDTDMTVDEFNAFMDIYGNFWNQAQVEGRANEALGQLSQWQTSMLDDPNLQRAQQLGLQQTPMDLDIYNAMRSSQEALYNPRNQAQTFAARGTRGSSGAELAQRQMANQNAAAIANIYPQALQASQDVAAQQQQMALSPFAALQAAQIPREQSYANVMRSMFGSPDFILS